MSLLHLQALPSRMDLPWHCRTRFLVAFSWGGGRWETPLLASPCDLDLSGPMATLDLWPLAHPDPLCGHQSTRYVSSNPEADGVAEKGGRSRAGNMRVGTYWRLFGS